MIGLRRLAWPCAVSLAAAGGCTASDELRAAAELDALRAEVAVLRAASAAAFESDPGLSAPAGSAPDAVVVALSVDMVRDVLGSAAARYLDRVRLHIRPDVVVRAGDEVRVRAGPITAYAGRWDLAVTIQRIDAVLQAGHVDLAAAGPDRLDVTIPVHIRGASGEALIDFTWDAARVAGVICGDFSVRETFSGVVQPRTELLRGHFSLISEGRGLVARPVLRERLSVSPVPTEESWSRVREILREQNHIFACGLALSPDGLEERLRTLLERGFRYDLPSSVLRPIPLPGTIASEVEVGGRIVETEVVLEPPLLTADWLWLRATVSARAYPEDSDQPRS